MSILNTLRTVFCIAFENKKGPSQQSFDNNNNAVQCLDLIPMKNMGSSDSINTEILDEVADHEILPKPAAPESQIAVMQTVANFETKEPRFRWLRSQMVSLQGRDLYRRPGERVFSGVTLRTVVFLSLRDCMFRPSTLFAEIGPALEKLLVLDLGRAIIGGYNSPAFPWPELRNLRELYLEGVLRTRSDIRLEDILANSPYLVILDLERASLGDLDLITVARLAPKLHKLYLGHTRLIDAPLIQLERSGFDLKELEVICLAETNVTPVGLQHLLKACPHLLSVSVKSSRVQEADIRDLTETWPSVRIKRTEITHVFATFPDRGCDHFTSVYGELPSYIAFGGNIGPDIFV